MRLTLRTMTRTARGIEPLRAASLLAVAGAIVVAAGCGRIGYRDLPEAPIDAGAPRRDASVTDARAEAEASLADAEEAATSEAGDDATDAPLDVFDAGVETGCTMSAAVDYCQSIPPLPSPPVIDGVLDCGPTLAAIAPEDWRGAAPLPPFPPGNTSEVAAAWRPDGLYVFVAVTTPAAIPADPSSADYFGAGVELFVDDDGQFAIPSRYDTPGTIQVIVTSPPYAQADASTAACVDGSADAGDAPADAQADATFDAGDDAAPDAPSDAADGAEASGSPNGQRGEIYANEAIVGPWTSTRFGTFPTATGFTFEAFVSAADLGLATWTLAAGGQVGFDVAVDVSFPDVCTVGLEGHRAGQYFLHVGTTPADAGPEAGPVGPPYYDTRSFCAPTLAAM